MKKLSSILITLAMVTWPISSYALVFGYNLLGASNQQSTAVNCGIYAAPEIGTVTNVSVYTAQEGNGASNGNLGIVSDVGGTATTKLATGTTSFIVGTSRAWATSTINNLAITATNYWLCYGGQGGAPGFQYDVGAAGQNKDFTMTINNASWNTTFPVANNSLARKPTIYATYIVAASVTTNKPKFILRSGIIRSGVLRN